MFPATTTRVQINTEPDVNEQIRARTQSNLEAYSGKSKQQISQRIFELNREWDTERLLEANAAGMVVLTVVLGLTKNKLWFLASGMIGAFLLQHALHGWCPPVPVIRQLGVRTSTEIHEEIVALKALRGDFDVTTDASIALDQACLTQ